MITKRVGKYSTLYIPDFPKQNWLGIWAAIGALLAGVCQHHLFSQLAKMEGKRYEIIPIVFFMGMGPILFFFCFSLGELPRIRALVLGFSSCTICALTLWCYAETKDPRYVAEIIQRQKALEIAREYQGKKKGEVGVIEEWRVVYAFEEAAPNTGSGVQMLIASDTEGKHHVVFFGISGCGQTMEGRARVGRKIKVTKQVIFADSEWHPLVGEQVVYFANNCAESR